MLIPSFLKPILENFSSTGNNNSCVGVALVLSVISILILEAFLANTSSFSEEIGLSITFDT